MNRHKSKKKITKEKSNADLALMDKVKKIFSEDLNFNCAIVGDNTFLFSDPSEVKRFLTCLGPDESDVFVEYAANQANLLKTQRRSLEDLQAIRETKSEKEYCSEYDQLKNFIFAK